MLPSHTIGECYAALSLLDTSSNDIDKIEESSIEIMQSVATGTVSRASRDAKRDGISVHAGDYIGFSGGTIYADAPKAADASLRLAEALNASDYGILLLVRGIDADADEAEAIREALQKQHPLTEVILLDGGQPIYDYIMILE